LEKHFGQKVANKKKREGKDIPECNPAPTAIFFGENKCGNKVFPDDQENVHLQLVDVSSYHNS